MSGSIGATSSHIATVDPTRFRPSNHHHGIRTEGAFGAPAATPANAAGAPVTGASAGGTSSTGAPSFAADLMSTLINLGGTAGPTANAAAPTTSGSSPAGATSDLLGRFADIARTAGSIALAGTGPGALAALVA